MSICKPPTWIFSQCIYILMHHERNFLRSFLCLRMDTFWDPNRIVNALVWAQRNLPVASVRRKRYEQPFIKLWETCNFFHTFGCICVPNEHIYYKSHWNLAKVSSFFTTSRHQLASANIVLKVFSFIFKFLYSRIRSVWYGLKTILS